MKTAITAIVAAVLLSLCANAQTAEQIVQQNLSATKINTIESIVLKGEVTEYGSTSTISIECRNDGKMLKKTTDVIGTTIVCWYGNGGWVQNEMAGGSKKRPTTNILSMNGFEARNIVRDMGYMPRPDKAESVILSEQTILNGIPVYVLRATYDENEQRTLYIRQDNFLMMREIRKELNQGNLDVIVDYSDYQTTSGITIPGTIIKTVAGNTVSTYRMSSAEINTPLADILFAP